MGDRRVSKGIYETRYGWRLYVRIEGVLKPKRVHDPEHRLELAALKIKKDAWRVQARGPETDPSVTAAASGTFEADARTKYLPAVRAMTGFRERTYHIELWIKEFGTRPRSSIRSWEIAQVRDRWLTVGPKKVCTPGGHWTEVATPLSASQVNNRMRALQNLYTVLDGRRAPNPAREAGEADEPEAEARALTYDVVEAILSQIRDDRHGRALTAVQRQAIAAQMKRKRANASAIARTFGVSETTVRKIARRRARQQPETPGLTKLRLRVFAYTGFSHGELMGIDAADLHLDATQPWVWVGGRRKGKGTKGTAQPLTVQGAAALGALAAADGLGPFSPDSMRKTFLVACRKLDLEGLTPYDFRHSFATEVLEKTGGNLAVTQMLMRHQDQRTTLLYGKRAIDPVRIAALEMVRARGGFSGKQLPQSVTPPRSKAKRQPSTR